MSNFKVILFTKIPEKKTVYVGLTKISGIGFFISNIIIKKLGIAKNFKVSNLTSNQIIHINLIANKFIVKLKKKKQF